MSLTTSNQIDDCIQGDQLSWVLQGEVTHVH